MEVKNKNNMEIVVYTYNVVEGFHNYPNAPEFCSYLQARHRHLFVIECRFAVKDSNREIEINEQQRLIENWLYSKYGKPCEFGALSCEMIAEDLLKNCDEMCACFVREDGFGGALVIR